MRNKKQKGRCVKQKLPKFEEVVRTYDDLQERAAVILSETADYKSVTANVDCCEVNGILYMTDFLCEKEDGSYQVFECVYRQYMSKPKTMKLLNESQRHWESKGVAWGIITDVKKGGADL